MAAAALVLCLASGAAGAIKVSPRQRAADPATPVASETGKPAEAPRRISSRVQYDPPGAELPMVGSKGTDADGYPLATADRVGFLALLHHRRFADLTKYIEQLQGEFEKDYRKEYWPNDAIDSFQTADPVIAPLLDEWVKAFPRSFAPYAARGAYWNEVAWERRGHKFMNETSGEQVSGMEDANARALPDLTKAVETRPGLVAAYRKLIEVARMEAQSEGVKRGLLDKALAVCRDCFYVRVMYMMTLLPRWGGSYEEMAAFAAEARRASKNPKLRYLAGYPDWDRCQVLANEKTTHAKALHLCERAVALGAHWQFLSARGALRRQMGDQAGAVADFDRALALRPQRTEVLYWRARSLITLKQLDRAEQDVLLGLKIDPVERELSYPMKWLLNHFVFEGFQREKVWKFDEAITLYDHTLRLDPEYQQAKTRRQTAAALAPLVQAIEREPDSVEAHVKLDYALARDRRLDEVITMWTKFLERNPKEPRAYFERGGAYFNSGKRELAVADIDKSCGLGLAEACNIARRIKGK